MIRRILSVVMVLALAAPFVGCAEDEHRVTEKKEIRTESQPRDVSPGEPIVE